MRETPLRSGSPSAPARAGQPSMAAYKTFPDGLYPESGPVTIRQLKDWLAQFPDKRENGEDCEVWIETASSLSSGCSGLSSLNWDGSAGDVMLMLPE